MLSSKKPKVLQGERRVEGSRTQGESAHPAAQSPNFSQHIEAIERGRSSRPSSRPNLRPGSYYSAATSQDSAGPPLSNSTYYHYPVVTRSYPPPSPSSSFMRYAATPQPQPRYQVAPQYQVAPEYQASSGQDYFTPQAMSRPLAARFDPIARTRSAMDTIPRTGSTFGAQDMNPRGIRDSYDSGYYDDGYTTADEVVTIRMKDRRGNSRADPDPIAMPPSLPRPSILRRSPAADDYLDRVGQKLDSRDTRTQYRDEPRPARQPSVTRHTVSYDLNRSSGGVIIEPANTGRRRQSWHEPAASSGTGALSAYEDRLNQAASYQEDDGGPTVPLTSETLNRHQRREGGSSRSTKSSHSRAATKGTTRSDSRTDDENVTIKVTGTARVMVDGAQIDCTNGGAIKIERNNQIRGGYDRSSSDYSDRRFEDRQNRFTQLPARSRISSQSRQSYTQTPQYPMDIDYTDGAIEVKRQNRIQDGSDRSNSEYGGGQMEGQERDRHSPVMVAAQKSPINDQTVPKKCIPIPNLTSAYETVQKNGRKALRIILKGIEHLACPDSGSDRNIISKEFATENKIQVRRGKNDKKLFELGNGEKIESLGRAHIPCSLAKGLFPRRKQWFHVLANCAVPLIMGRPFLEETQILTKNRHLLERCPPELLSISSLKFIGSPRNRSGIGISLNGRVLMATPDTGSDLNLISLACAEREGFYIDRSREARQRLQVADGSEVKTVGRVYISSLSLDWRKAQTVSERPEYILGGDDAINSLDSELDVNEERDIPGEIFYVVDGLPCDVILGEAFLDKTDAFNTCTELFTNYPERKKHAFELKIFRYLGPLQTRFSRKSAKPPDNPPEEFARQQHDAGLLIERYRRSKAKRLIEELDGSKQSAAAIAEQAAAQAYDRLHLRCNHCHPQRAGS